MFIEKSSGFMPLWV